MSLFSVPLINGSRFSFSSLDFRPMGFRVTDIKELSYKTTLTPGKVFGTSAYPVGRTRGTQETDASFTIYREGWGIMLTALQALTTTSGLNPLGGGSGFMEVAFDIISSYSEAPASPTQTDVLKGCRIKSVDTSASEGNEALVVKVELDVMQIYLNGVLPLNLVVI